MQAVEDFSDLHTRAWQQLAKEEGKPQPFQWALRRAEGMKNEQVLLAFLESPVPTLLFLLSYDLCHSLDPCSALRDSGQKFILTVI